MLLAISLSVTIGGLILTNTQLVLASLPILALLYTIFIHTGYSRTNPIVWSWVPFLRSAYLFSQDPNTFLQTCKKQYGPIFTVNLGGKLMTFVTDPQCYPQITRARDGLSFKEVATDVGLNVLTQDRDYCDDMELDALAHQQYQKYLGGAQLDEITQRYQQFLNEWFADHFSKVNKRNNKIGLLDLCGRAIFSASTRALFGDLLVDDGTEKPTEPGDQFSDNFFTPKKLWTDFKQFDNIFPLLMGGLPSFIIDKKGIKSRHDLMQSLKTIRSDACSFMAARQDLLSVNPPTKRPNDQHNFSAVQLGALWALQGNTIPASFWTCFFLLQNEDALRRVLAELKQVTSEQSTTDTNQAMKHGSYLTRDSLKKLVLLDCAINESLRMATGSMMMRKVLTNLTLDLPTGPLSVKKGDNIALYPYLAHHDPEIFPNPDTFNLDRWIGQTGVDMGTVTNIHGVKVPNAFMPFGSGISMCPGRHFARAEIKMFIAVSFNLFDVESLVGTKHPGYLLSRAGLGIFPPAKDIEIIYAPKQI